MAAIGRKRNVRFGCKTDIDRDLRPASFQPMWKFSLILASVAVSGCNDGCGNSLIRRADAPDGEHSAVMFQRDCGATTSFSTQLSIVRPGERVGSGNTFRADDDHGAAFAGDWGGSWAEMRWLGPDHLLVRYAARSRVFAKKEQVAGVHVSYQSVER